MPFEAFLSETHARPPRASRFGFAASLALHGPPMALFVTTWLTRAMLIGSSGQLADEPVHGTTFYVPISVYGQGAGTGGPAGPVAGGGSAGKTGTHARVGLMGRSGRAGRRGLIAPREIKKLPNAAPWTDPFMLGSYASSDLHGAVGHDSGSGDGQPGAGNGSGSSGNGTGGASAGLGGGAGNGILPAPPDRPKPKKEVARIERGEAQGQKAEAHEADDDQLIGADLDVLLDGRAMKAAYISQDSAAYYRTHDDMPGLPNWLAGHREYAMLFRICVTTEGTVSNVVVLKSATPDADQVLCAAIEKWRYRPRIVDGVARPFCHPIRIVYSRP